jgi:hypothetical protein
MVNIPNIMKQPILLTLIAVLSLFILGNSFHETKGQMDMGNRMTDINPITAYVEPSYFPLIVLASVVIITGVTGIAVAIIKKLKKGESSMKRIRFIDVIRDGDYYPSLPRFQFLVWTFVISFVYLSVYLIRIYSGKFDAPFIDNNLLILLGISIASPIISNVISGYKYTDKLTDLTSGNIDYDDPKYSFKTMLFENGKPALFRYQMFLWTFIGVFNFSWCICNKFTHIYIVLYRLQARPR